MKTEISTFDRRMEILDILMNQNQVSRLELARRFSVSDVAIGRDITALSRYAPIASKMGRHGGVYIIKEYKREKAYLSREEENLLNQLIQKSTGKKKELLQMILYKFAMPKD